MARIRSIKPEFFRHYDLWAAEKETGLPLRLSFEGMWCVADREGRFKWRPEELKIEILPYDAIDFSRVLDALWTRGFIAKYRVNGRDYGHIPSFSRHQVINNRERASDLPEPNDINILTREERVADAIPTRGQDEKEEGKGREGEGKVVPITTLSDAEASFAPLSLSMLKPADGDWSKAVFRQGLDWLSSVTGKPPDKLRSLVGRWLKTAGDSHRSVFEAMAMAESIGVSEPVEWITASLGGKTDVADYRDPFLAIGAEDARKRAAGG